MPAGDSLKPATKGDLAAVERRPGAVEVRLGEFEGRVLEAVRDAKTEILVAFERYFAGEQIKFRRLRADLLNLDASTDKRLEIVERRLFEIEKKLLIKPPDAA